LFRTESVWHKLELCHWGSALRLPLTTAIDVTHVNSLGWMALLEALILGDGGPAHAEIGDELVSVDGTVDYQREAMTDEARQSSARPASSGKCAGRYLPNRPIAPMTIR